jgi:hypothetical protein
MNRLVDPKEGFNADGTGARECQAGAGSNADLQVGVGARFFMELLEQVMEAHRRCWLRRERVSRLPAGRLTVG